MGRNSKGQFTRSKSKSRTRTTTRSAPSTAIVVAPPRTITRTQTRYVQKPKHKGGGKRRHHGGGSTLDGPKALELGGWGGAIGYIEQNNASTFNQIPTFGKLPRVAVIAGVAYMFRRKSKHVDRLAASAIAITGYKLGQQNFQLTGDYDD